jgi:hypothetical protein
MAVGTASAIIGGLGMVKGAFDTIDASGRKKKHPAELDNYQRQDLENVVRDNVQISTIGSDYMAEENARGTSTAMQGVQQGGARAIIGATQGVVNQNNQANREGRQYLDDQAIKRDYAIAQDEATIRGMQEQREYQDLAGIGNAINTANQDFNTGLTGAMNSAMYLGSSLESVTISNRWTLTIANVYYRSRGDFGGFNVDTLNISTASAVIVTNVASNSSAFYCTSKSKALKKIYIDGSNIVSTLTDFKLGVFAFQRANSVTPTAINIITIGEFTLTKASGDGCHFWEITPTNLEIPAGYLVSCVLMRTGGTGTEINCNMTFKFDDYVA